MATDGVKIIDSDLARDTYNKIIDLFDSEVALNEIQGEFSFEVDWLDEFDYEIYITSLALAFWEIGYMNDNLLKIVKQTLDKNEGVKFWSEECSEKEGNKRKLTLDKFWEKINTHNLKPRKPKKYRKITNFYFQEGDIITFQLDDGLYRSVICYKIIQHRGNCTYDLIQTNYKSLEKPTKTNMLNFDIIGHWMGCGYTIEETKSMFLGVKVNNVI